MRIAAFFIRSGALIMQAESREYLSEQLITYLGNKRALLACIEGEVVKIRQKLCAQKCVCLDLFSGSGVVARMLKRHSSLLIANDIELYSKIINLCYLSNKANFDKSDYSKVRLQIEEEIERCGLLTGIISENYAPRDDSNILPGERAFYTRENAMRIDTYCALIEKFAADAPSIKPFFLAPLLAEASVHVNTSGVFKSFYKDRATGLGCFGGTGRDALSRILAPITLKKPVLSRFNSDVAVFCEDALSLAGRLKNIDIAYLDPPYNQHPYGSNYFMLNLIVKNSIDAPISRVAGIPNDWKRSAFNCRGLAFASLEKVAESLDAKFIIVSYNSEGFIAFEDMKAMLKKYGTLQTVEVKYNTFRACRNLCNRNIHVSEALFILQKD